MLKRVAVAWAVGCLALAGCRDDEKAVDVNRNDTVPVRFDVSLRGGVTATVNQTVEARFILRRTTSRDADQRRAQVLGVEPTEPIRLGDAALLAGFAVLSFEGDGTYTIPVGSPYDVVNGSQNPNRQPEVTSSIKVEWWPTGSVDAPRDLFMRRAKPCKAEVQGDGLKGTVTCPDVTNEAQDKHFSLSLSWTAPESGRS